MSSPSFSTPTWTVRSQAVQPRALERPAASRDRLFHGGQGVSDSAFLAQEHGLRERDAYLIVRRSADRAGLGEEIAGVTVAVFVEGRVGPHEQPEGRYLRLLAGIDFTNLDLAT